MSDYYCPNCHDDAEIYVFLNGCNKGKATDMYDDWRKYEVIGNVWENPDLMATKDMP